MKSEQNKSFKSYFAKINGFMIEIFNKSANNIIEKEAEYSGLKKLNKL